MCSACEHADLAKPREPSSDRDTHRVDFVLKDQLMSRTGAAEPWYSCRGCFLSYVGELEVDRSLADAFRGRRHRGDEDLREIPSRRHRVRPAGRAQRQGVKVNGARRESRCRRWTGEFNSEGFAVQKVGGATCLVVALILQRRRRAKGKPRARPRLVCGHAWCVADEHVVEEAMLKADVNKRPDPIERPKQISVEESLLPGWDLDAIADEILNVPRDREIDGHRTVNSRRLFYSERELDQRSRKEIPFGDDLAGFGIAEQDGAVHVDTEYFDDHD